MTLQAGRISLGVMLAVMGAWGQVSIPSVGTPVTQDFNTLASSGTSSTLPTGWVLLETGTNFNTTYTAGTGSGNAGDTYSFGAASNSERAFGTLLSGSLTPTIGASFTNNTGTTITGLVISYTGEQWRLGTAARVDRLDFQYSVNATSLATASGTWTDVDSLDFSSPFTTATGARDGNAAENRTAISFTISSLNIPNGATFWIRWNDFNASGADDGLAIDDFSLTAQGTGGSTCPTISLGPASLPSGTQGVLYSQVLSASGGVGSYSFAVTGGGLPSGINLAGNTISGTHGGNGTFPVTITATDSSTPTACTGAQAYSLVIAPVSTITNINVIQGSGLASSLVGQTATTSGIVTALRSNGFYLQNAEADYDANPQTSEGILVFTSSAPIVSVGQRIRVTGTITEFTSSTDLLGGSGTQIGSPTAIFVLSSGNALPAAVAIDSTMLTAAGGQQQLERFEGMRVSLPSLTVVAPTGGTVSESNATASSNGVFTAVFTGVPTPFREPGIQSPLVAPLCEAGAGCAIPVWDNNPERIQIDSDRITGTSALNVRVGQTVSGVVGVLDNGFGVNQVSPDGSSVPVVGGSGISEGIAPAAKPSEVTVATYNMERLYDTVDGPGGDIVVSAGALANRLNKASLGIRVNLGAPDIIGLQEIENLNVLQLLAAKINLDAAGAYTYTPFTFEGNDPGGIDVAFLVKNTVTVVSLTQLGQATTYTSPCTGAQEILNDRPPVLFRGSVTKAGRTLDLVVIVNHLRSLNGISDTTPCALGTDGQRVRAKRAAQAEFLANLIQSEITSNPNVKLISVGDMNAFDVNDGYVDVIGTVTGNPTAATQVADASADLVNPNLLNLLNVIPDPAQRFSYVFDGSHQTLDHLLYTQSLRDQVTNGGYVRINSEFPQTDRNDSNSARRLSDHDPGVIYVTTAQPIVSGILVQRGGLILNRTTNTYNGNLVIRNTGTAALTGPFTVALTGLPAGVSLANAAGTNYQGSYLVNSATTIAAGGALLVPVQFSNPANVAINYTTKVYSGAF
jgi:predicted extracellular nuclease